MTAADIYHPGVPRTLKRVDAGLVGWMAHQFELLAAGRVWDDLGYRSQGNAFTRHLDGGPSIFATKQEIGHQARKLGRMSADGQANVQASNDRLNKIIKPARATKQQIVYSKARAR